MSDVTNESPNSGTETAETTAAKRGASRDEQLKHLYAQMTPEMVQLKDQILQTVPPVVIRAAFRELPDAEQAAKAANAKPPTLTKPQEAEYARLVKELGQESADKWKTARLQEKTGKARRGRPPGSKNAPKTQPTAASTAAE